MSGGVDSSVAAALLAEQGHDVIGLSMQLYDQSEGQTVVRQLLLARRPARRAARRRGDQHPALHPELRAAVRRAGRRRTSSASTPPGRTPLPCARCNSDLKFATLAERARGLRRRRGGDRPLRARRARRGDGRYLLEARRRPVEGPGVFPVLADAGSARARGVSGRRSAEGRRSATTRARAACRSPTSRTARRSASSPTTTTRRSSRARAPERGARRRHRRRGAAGCSAGTAASTASRSASARGWALPSSPSAGAPMYVLAAPAVGSRRSSSDPRRRSSGRR